MKLLVIFFNSLLVYSCSHQAKDIVLRDSYNPKAIFAEQSGREPQKFNMTHPTMEVQKKVTFEELFDTHQFETLRYQVEQQLLNVNVDATKLYQLRLALAKSLIGVDESVKASEILTRLIEQYASKVDAYIVLAKSYLVKNNLYEARYILDQAKDLAGQSVHTDKLELELLYAERKFDIFYEMAKKMLQLYPDDVDFLLIQSRALSLRGEFALAIKNLEKVGVITSDYPDFFMMQAMIYFIQKSYDQAEYYLKRLAQIRRGDAFAFYHLALIESNKQQIAAAKNYLAKIKFNGWNSYWLKRNINSLDEKLNSNRRLADK